jgi:26S proteasome non-ATPase regulatory subunit 10
MNPEQQQLNQQLFEAVKKGDISTITALLEAGADINAKDQDFHSLLHCTAYYGQADSVRLLLNHRADVDKADEYGLTSLHYAATSGRTAVIKILLKHGADINKAAKNGEMPLLLAVGNGHAAVVTLLLNHGAQINGINLVGQTPLHRVTCSGHVAVAVLLLRYGTQVDKIDKYGYSPLHYATEQNYLTTAHLIQIFSTPGLQAFRADPKRYLEEYPADERILGAAPLHFAVLSNKLDIVQVLLKKKPTILVGDERKHSPLLYALWFGHTAVAQELINTLAQQRGGNVVGALTLGDAKGRCILSYIAQKDYRFLNYLITQHRLLT